MKILPMPDTTKAALLGLGLGFCSGAMMGAAVMAAYYGVL